MDKPHIFAEGIYWRERNAKAPEHILDELSINVGTFMEWLNSQEPDEQGYIRLDRKLSKDGKIYFERNLFKPTKRNIPKQEDPNAPKYPKTGGTVPLAEGVEYPQEEIDPSEIPF